MRGEGGPVVGCEAMREAERRAFAAGVSEEGLMEQAGRGVADAILQRFPGPGRARAVYGRGHNGGDALVVGRLLRERGWQVEAVSAAGLSRLAPLAEKKLGEFHAQPDGPGGAVGPFVVVDGVLGTGTRGAPTGAAAEAIAGIVSARENGGARVFAVDLPSGLHGDTGVAPGPCVRADWTVAIGGVKRGLLADGATDRVGRIALVPLEGVELPVSGEAVAVAPALRGLLSPAGFDRHKGDAGRVLVVAGSPGYAGAAALAAIGALRAGAGLVTLCVGREVYPVLAPALAARYPEVMVRATGAFGEALEIRCDAAVIGPGLLPGAGGEGFCLESLRGLLDALEVPAVLDAGALDAGLIGGFENPAGPRLLTPHPGELRRIAGENPGSRADWAREVAGRWPVTLLLKGARTLVAERGRPLSHNTTGTPGMATGGVGDVLSGVCGALLARGLGAYDAARCGAWLMGRAAEAALAEGGYSEESLLAGDVAAHLGRAFSALREGGW